MIMKQVKSNYYYIFWGVMSAAVVGACGVIAHSNYALASSRSEMSEAIRDYVLIKPFPLLCRDAVYQ